MASNRFGCFIPNIMLALWGTINIILIAKNISVWKENGSYTLFTADTRDVQSPDNRTMAVTPPWLCGDHIDCLLYTSP